MKFAGAAFAASILLAVTLIPALPVTGAADDPAQAAKLAIGVRSKARPFSYRLPARVIESDSTRGPLSRTGYGGYIVRICDAALSEMLIGPSGGGQHLRLEDIIVYDIDQQCYARPPADGREPQCEEVPDGVLNTPARSRFEALGTRFDILCDPATITNERRDVIVSPPLFLTGISYLSRRNQPALENPCGDSIPVAEDPDGQPKALGTNTSTGANEVAIAGKPALDGNRPNGDAAAAGTSSRKLALIGLVGGTNAQSRGIKALIDARELPLFEEQLVKYLRQQSGTLVPKDSPCGAKGELVHKYPNHEKAAKAFCDGIDFNYYVGDLEIIRTYAEAIPGCKFDNGIVTYTNDRYGIFGKAIGESTEVSGQPAPDGSGAQRPPPRQAGESPSADRKLLVARFFEIVAQKVVFNPSILDKAYNDTFPNQPQSRKLKLFYWAIRGERLPETELPTGNADQK
ncbi:type 2 periplasmic-binding domain-containing protein [Neorhizobium alkalisoli]|uniref:hypothetical protein n=1 Tax=Neorhizobium alkalisoli TaxID=528178 RepID=UPI000CF9707D|nr:hypothetical protein [Neorhizobium alkalisoli]